MLLFASLSPVADPHCGSAKPIAGAARIEGCIDEAIVVEVERCASVEVDPDLIVIVDAILALRAFDAYGTEAAGVVGVVDEAVTVVVEAVAARTDEPELAADALADGGEEER